MLGWAHLLRGGRLDPAATRRGLEVLERNTLAQARLIDDLLDVSRIVTGELRLDGPRLVELPAVIESALEVIRPAARAREITLDVQLDPTAGPVSGDAVRLQQVVWNLLSNAVKFTPRGGRVEVRLVRADANAEIVVRDNGEGIEADFLPFVFERFRQADSTSTRAHGGLGLGLAIVRHLVELHGGEVRAASAGTGQGSTFVVRLPILPVRMEPLSAQGTAQRPPIPGSSPAELAGLRVLVVDDEQDARDMLSAVLASNGAEVTAVGSVHDALEALAVLHPDVLVSDICMPGEDGYALIRQVRARPAEEGGLIPAAALTAHISTEDRRRAMSAGFQMHASKPISPPELVAIVKALARWLVA
jgi:CheY-like chemotaxis protein/two-component sensor histidine kinase